MVTDPITTFPCVVARTTRNGIVIWATQLEGSGFAYTPKGIEATSDGGVILAVDELRLGSGTNGLLVKMREDGSVEWSSEIVTGADVGLASVTQSSGDGHYVVTGHTARDSSQTHKKLFVQKFDSLGSSLWSFHFDQDAGGEFPARILEAANSDIIVCGGSASSLVGGSAEPLILRLSSSGSLLWANSYGLVVFLTQIFDCVEAPDGSIYFTGTILPTGALFGAVDSAGSLVMAKSIGNAGFGYGASLAIMPSLNYLLTGYTLLPTQGSTDILLMEMTPSGGLVRALAYGDSGPQAIIRLHQNNGIFVGTGVSHNSATASDDVFIASFS